MTVVTQFAAARDYTPEPRFQAMFEGAAIGIAICGLDGRILESNPALSGMLGYNREELAGAHADDLFPETHPDPCPEIGRAVDSHQDSYNDRRDSSPGHRWLGELLRGERASIEMENRYRRKDGSALWGHLTVALGRDSRGQPAFLIVTLADATVRKRVEEQLRAAEKMEVIGRLAGGIAHDFNNLLTGILLYCDLLTSGLESTHFDSERRADGAASSGDLVTRELRQHIEEVRMAGEQGAALTQQLLAIARKQAAEPRPILINEIVVSTENLLRRLIGEPIELVTVLDPSAGLVVADPAQLRQILMNLVLNARDAMPRGGKIRVITRRTEFPSEGSDKVSSEAGSEDESGGVRPAVSLAVQDNGCGMNAETRARLFEPFFTTKNPGEGTGLGLATVERIVSEAGGKIRIESALGRGTCIEVFLPAFEYPTAEPATQPPASMGHGPAPAQIVPIEIVNAAAGPGAGEVAPDSTRKTILLVDDHAAARTSMERILLDAQHRILAAASGPEALKIFAQQSGAIDLLIADVMMPGMNGMELAETLLRQKPGMKVLLVSGYQDTPVALATGAVELIQKPFSRSALIERVEEVLQGP